MKRKGFSLMELLIVMVILAGLATMVIPNMSSSTEAVKLTSMKNDARNTIALLQAKYIDEPNYANIFTNGNYTDTNGDGFAETTLEDGTKIPVSADNTIILESMSCNGESGKGFFLTIINPQVPEKYVKYYSCFDAKISVVSGDPF